MRYMLKPVDVGAVLALEDGRTQSAAAGAFLGVLGPMLLASLEFSSSVNSRSEYTSSSSLSSEKKYTFQIAAKPQFAHLGSSADDLFPKVPVDGLPLLV